jgi:hypothetical protein
MIIQFVKDNTKYDYERPIEWGNEQMATICWNNADVPKNVKKVARDFVREHRLPSDQTGLIATFMRQEVANAANAAKAAKAAEATEATEAAKAEQVQHARLLTLYSMGGNLPNPQG